MYGMVCHIAIPLHSHLPTGAFHQIMCIYGSLLQGLHTATYEMGKGLEPLECLLALFFLFLGCIDGPKWGSTGSTGRVSLKGGRMPSPKSRSTTRSCPSSRLRTRLCCRVSFGLSGYTRGACAHCKAFPLSLQLLYSFTLSLGLNTSEAKPLAMKKETCPGHVSEAKA